MNSIALSSEYIPQTRPYSQNELQDKRNFLYKKLRLGEVMAQHKDCGHFYLTKKNSRKEKEILSNNHSDQGNCSVCWRMSKTSYAQSDNASKLVCEYCNTFDPKFEKSNLLSYNDIDVETVFYSWLYEELNDRGSSKNSVNL